MLASELRIGNWIFRRDLGDESLRPETILGLDKKAKCSGPITVLCEYSDLSPIPLSPEWLQRAGFWLNGGRMFIGLEWDTGIEVTDGQAILHGQSGRLYLCEVRYVHQLQNLFFALTGTELEFKQVDI